MAISYIEHQVLATARMDIVNAYVNHALGFLVETGTPVTSTLELPLYQLCHTVMENELSDEQILEYIELHAMDVADIFDYECVDWADEYIIRSLGQWVRAFIAFFDTAQ